MRRQVLIASVMFASVVLPISAQQIGLDSLIEEMINRDVLSEFPQVVYESLQASSYNRESVPPRGSEGWFADSDGTGYIREEKRNGRREWVVMEHTGPGCITRIWTPYFYYDLKEHRGPRIQMYLDDEETPAIEEYFIELLTGGMFKDAPSNKNSLRVSFPFSSYTARAGDLYLPIPFGKCCKVTLDKKPFYNIINYRAYPEGTDVQTWSREIFDSAKGCLERAAAVLLDPPDFSAGVESSLQEELAPGGEAVMQLPGGANAVHCLRIRVRPQEWDRRLRSIVLRMTFDGQETVWAPVGDFFCSGDEVNPFKTWEREMEPDGTMTCRWVMPYREQAQITLSNFGDEKAEIELRVKTAPREWTPNSMHFHANWRIDEAVPGTPFQDWNFIDIRGKGVYVGDAWTVLCADTGWWGEGDEKIYIDGDYEERQFPSHFGTGSEDYYGWAGGEVPTGADVFSLPFLANVRVGNAANPGATTYARSRVLDAIPFNARLRFDMEASFGVQMRNPWNLLHYSVITFWYAIPGAVHNLFPQPEWASRPVMSVEELDALELKAGRPSGR